MGFFINPRALLLFGLTTYCGAGHSQTNPHAELATPSVDSAQPAPPGRQAGDRIMPLEVVINGTKSSTWLLLERNGEIYAPFDAFEEWRVQLPPDAKPIDFKLFDQTYWPLSAVPGYRYKLDFANQSVELLFSPEAFSATRLTQEKSKRIVASPVLPSLFFNYDLNYSTTMLRNGTDYRDLGMLAEIGGSNEWGVITSSHTGRNLTNDSASGIPSKWVRLETTFTRDFPEENRTLRIGDTAVRDGMWGRSVYFGGIQYGSNFALTPGFITQPAPALLGISAAPSTVELYVNDVLRQVSQVPTGPFVIDNFPSLTGSGDVRMVVHDILGRETVIEQSFFTTSQLLSKGLDDWSIEAGSIRRDMGIADNHYGPGFASGTWRHGYTNNMTFEGRVEATKDMQTLGVGIVSTLTNRVLGKASLAGSRGQNLNGGLWLLGAEHQTLRSSLSFQIQGASVDFHQLGQPIETPALKRQMAGNWSYNTENYGSFGMGLAALNRHDGTNVTTLSGNYSTRIGKQNSLTFTLSRAIDGASGTSAGVLFIMPLEHNRIVNASVNSSDGQQDFNISAMQNPDHENNLGWRVLAGRQQSQSRAEGGLYYLGRYGRLSADASSSTDQSTLRLGANGGLVLADSTLFVTERLDQSFAVAEVAGYGDVSIGLGNNMLTDTNKNGVALVPRLMAYQRNSIRLDPSELPLSAELDSIEQTVVPAWRSAVKVTFPVRGGRGALLKILFEDGEDAPAGATVKLEGSDEEFYVARRGAAFMTGLQTSNKVILNWNGQQCRIDVELPPESPDEIARLGPLLCKGVTR